MVHLDGQRIVIIGAARQGIALARYLCWHKAQVVMNDRLPLAELTSAVQALADLPVEWVCGGHPTGLLDQADLVCISGGVPLTLPLIVEAQARNISLSNDSQIFMEVVPCKVVGITGSAGKTTTTTLVGCIAQQALARSPQSTPYRRVWIGGNIGEPLIDHVDEMDEHDLVVLELSSFQLELMTCSPHVAAILNITPNHLDRHKTVQTYSAAKARIFQWQTPDGVAVLGRDDEGAWGLAGKEPGHLVTFGMQKPFGISGTYVENDRIYFVRDGQVTSLFGCEAISLRGRHNLMNVLAACAISMVAHLPHTALESAVRDFKGVDHRLEYVRSWGGADWYNDSIATTPERVIAAIGSFSEPLVWLAGGRDKNLPWETLVGLARQRVRHLVLFGELAEKIECVIREVGGAGAMQITRCQGLYAAVQEASRIVHPEEVVLLSPGGTSFDEFRDFEERGECFKQWVMSL